MHLEYANKLKQILQDERLINKYYNSFSSGVKNRLSELRAADSLQDIPEVPPPRRHKLSGGKTPLWSVSVSKNYRMLLKPLGEYNVNDLSSIKSVEIVKIEDYH